MSENINITEEKTLEDQGLLFERNAYDSLVLM